MLLPSKQRQKLDETDDALFYEAPRFVTHVDEGFIQQLTDLYRDRISPKSRVLDLMSSWVSHLPEDVEYEHVEGHGLNQKELARNPQLDHFFVQNLNDSQQLSFADCSFDAVLIAVSVQYLQQPEAVFAEICRVLKPGGVAIVSFSNRMFYQKAIQAWRDGSDRDRIELVKRYFQSVPEFGSPEVMAKTSDLPPILQLLGVPVGDPFYAVIAYRS